MTKLEARLDANREEAAKRLAKLKDETISDPISLHYVLCAKNIFLDEPLRTLNALIGTLYAQGISIDNYPVEPLFQEQINDAVKELSAHVETMVENYIEESSDG